MGAIEMAPVVPVGTLPRMFDDSGRVSLFHPRIGQQHIVWLSAIGSDESRRGMQKTYPFAPLAINLTGKDTRELIAAARAGIPVFIGRDRLDLFREQLVSRDRMLRGIVPYLQAVLPAPLNPSGEHLIGSIFRVSRACATVGDLMDELKVSGSTARGRLNKKGLPTLLSWFSLARALHGALLLQSDDSMSVAEAGRLMGYVDHSGLSKTLRQAFRLRSPEVRARWGWEWLVARWLTANVGSAHSSVLKGIV